MHAGPHPHVRAPWLIVAISVLAVVALTVGVLHFSAPGCVHGDRAGLDAAIRPGPGARTGQAVFYDPGRAEDRCSIEPLDASGLYASLPPGQYGDGAICGAYLEITGPLGTVEAEVIDMCPGCSASQLDLSTTAFAAIQRVSAGTAPITYELAADPALPAPLAIQVGAGSTSGSLAVQVLNHGNPLAGVEVRQGTGWLRLAARGDGYWVAAAGAGGGPFEFQVTDVLGHTADLTGIALRPGVVQQTAVLMYGPSPSVPSVPPTSAPASAPPPAARQASPAPVPVPSPGALARRTGPASTASASC